MKYEIGYFFKKKLKKKKMVYLHQYCWYLNYETGLQQKPVIKVLAIFCRCSIIKIPIQRPFGVDCGESQVTTPHKALKKFVNLDDAPSANSGWYVFVALDLESSSSSIIKKFGVLFFFNLHKKTLTLISTQERKRIKQNQKGLWISSTHFVKTQPKLNQKKKKGSKE